MGMLDGKSAIITGAGAGIAIGYLVRGVGAMQDNALVWFSPFGWAQLMNAFGDERWWPAALLVVATAGLKSNGTDGEPAASVFTLTRRSNVSVMCDACRYRTRGSLT